MFRFTLAIGIAIFFCSCLFGQDRSVIHSYMTDTAPVIDGDLSDAEWDAAGPWINVTTSSPNAQASVDFITDDEFGGDEDMSFRFKTMWVEDTPNFYVLYEVFDDIAMEEDPSNLWERDQLETFIDGTSIEGDLDGPSFHWFASSGETYGKLGVSRFNTFEGNSQKMTDDMDVWDEGLSGNIISVSAAKELDTNADYRIEIGISLIPMIDDVVTSPFFESPTEDAVAIVADSTQIKFNAGVSDDDNFAGDGTERSSELAYYRELDGEPAAWDVTAAFADLVFTGMFEGAEPVAGDCNGDGAITTDDLSCATNDGLADTLSGLGILPGDFDGNKKVEFADFLVLSSNFGQDGKTYAEGNADGAGKVEFADFLILSDNFGSSSAAASAVPEPSSLILLLVGFVALARGRSRSFRA